MTDNSVLPIDTLDQYVPDLEATDSPFSGLVAPLNRLAMTAGSEFSIDEMLRDLCRTAIETLAVDGAGIMATHDTGLRFVHASETLVAVEQLQQDLQEGPCQASAATQQVVIIEDIASSTMWPKFVAASKLAGVGAMVAVPLLARGRSWGGWISTARFRGCGATAICKRPRCSPTWPPRMWQCSRPGPGDACPA